jgi:hypothetical protein
MEQEFVKGGYGGTEIHVGLAFHKIIDYDRKALRRALVKGAAEIRKEARRLVARRAISASGQFPGSSTGALRKAIGVVSKGSRGGWIKIGVKKTAGMADFYPAFLFYGTKGQGKIERLAAGEGHGQSNRRGRGERAAIVADRKASTGFIVAPRANYMTAALEAKGAFIRDTIRESLKNALIPR